MSAVVSEVLSVSAFFVVGWIALFPVRNRLGAFAYHVAALPVGLMAAPIALVVSSTTGRPLDGVSAFLGAALFIALLWAMQRVIVDTREPGTPVRASSFMFAGGVLLGLGTVFGFLGLSSTNYDSIASYWPLGVELSRKGVYTAVIASSRSALIPSMNAIHVMFGSDWAYVIYPLLATTMALWLGMSLWNGPLSRGGADVRIKRIVAGCAVAFMVLEPSFVFNAFFVHSQLSSAIYILIALTGTWMAIRPDDEDAPVNHAYLIVAGVAVAGLALSRPDGLAYMFVPVAVAIAALTLSDVRWRSVAAFFAPAVLLVCIVCGAGFANLGIWKASKLSGATTLAILTILVLSSAAPWLLQLIQRFVPFRMTGERFLGLLVPIAAALMAVAWVIKRDSAQEALANAGINLFLGAGGYFHLWYAVVLLLVIAALTGDALRAKSWTRPAFLGVLLFFAIAGLVHGVSHEGRIGAGDSFNRIAFEILPVIVWFGAAVAARILTAPAEPAPGVAETGAEAA